VGVGANDNVCLFFEQNATYESCQTKSRDRHHSGAARTFLCRAACGAFGRAFLEKFFAGLRSFFQ
jgi:hypothetical protein